MEERAAGKFDKYKEDQFEAFWGQKQTLHHEVRAGESAKIKLAELVEAGLIKVGDEMSYKRSFGRHYGTPWMIEKDLKVCPMCPGRDGSPDHQQVVSIDGTTLTVAIPPGRLRYPQLQKQPGASNIAPTASETIKIGVSQEAPQANGTVRDGVEDEENSTSGGVTTGTGESNGVIYVPGDDSDPRTSVDSDQSSKVQKLENLSSFGACDAAQFNAKPEEHQKIVKPDAVANNRKNNDENGTPQKDGDIPRAIPKSPMASLKNHGDSGETSPAADELVKPGSRDPTVSDEIVAKGQKSRPIPKQEPSQIDPETGCFLYDVWKPGGLEDKIIEIDGRIDPKDAAAASTWRSIRLLRNNQDLGSLFDIREEHYVWKSSTIVKMPKKVSLGNKYHFEDEGPQNYTKMPRKRGKDSTEERVSQGTPSSGRNPKSQSTTKQRVAELSDDRDDDDDFAEGSEDDEDIAERDSDGEFGVRARPKKEWKQQWKLRGRPATEHTSWCPHCGTGFTKETNMKIHIRKTCKRVPREEHEANHDRRESPNEDRGRENELGKTEGEDRKSTSKQTFCCPHCGTGFAYAGNLKNHIQKGCKQVPAE